MPNYIRKQLAGASYFFTITLADRRSSMLTDHLHAIWQMPEDDGDYALRWRMIKSHFSRQFSASDNCSNSKI